MTTTRITKLLQCRYPVILPGMSWISTSELVAAVSNAGGIGILATGPLTPTETGLEIDRIRSLTSRPFGVGVTLLMPGAAENARVALDKQVPIINTSLGKADWISERLRNEYNGKLICTVTNRQHGRTAVEVSQCHALLVTGHEAAAHGGDVTSMCLIPAMRDEFPEIPLIAAGGFADGRGLVAALALGADAVAMGSRLAMTIESPLSRDTQDAIVQSDESQTIYGKHFDGIPARVLKTPTAQSLMRNRPWFPIVVYRAVRAAQSMNMPLWIVLGGLLTQWDKIFVLAQFGAATEYLTRATVHGDVKQGVQFIGQSQGLIRDIPTVHELMQRIVEEARTVSRNQAQHVFGEEATMTGEQGSTTGSTTSRKEELPTWI